VRLLLRITCLAVRAVSLAYNVSDSIEGKSGSKAKCGTTSDKSVPGGIGCKSSSQILICEAAANHSICGGVGCKCSYNAKMRGYC
jgi:hypothetical protein